MSCNECTTTLEDAAGAFWDRVRDKQVPINGTLELTYRCNFDCVHCYCVVDPERTPTEMTTDEWKGVIDQLADAGGISVTFTGGDPFLRKDFLPLAEYAHSRRFAIRILTNASFITTDRIADRVAALVPASVSISLYGATRETYRAVTGRSDFYDRAIAGIRRLRERGVRVEVKLPMLRENFHERKRMADLALELGASWRIDAEMTPRDDGDISPLAHALTDEQLATYVREVAGPLPEAERFKPDDKLCQPGVFSYAIGPFGDVYPCMQIRQSMGNIRQQRFAEIWAHSQPLNELRSLRARDFEGCNQCDHFGPCKPCLGVSLNATGSMTNPTPSTCRITSFRSRLPVVA